MLFDPSILCARPHLESREEAKLAGEFVESWLADGLAEREEEEGGLAAAMMPVCDVHEAGNHTLRRLGASVDRCEMLDQTQSEEPSTWGETREESTKVVWYASRTPSERASIDVKQLIVDKTCSKVSMLRLRNLGQRKSPGHP